MKVYLAILFNPKDFVAYTTEQISWKTEGGILKSNYLAHTSAFHLVSPKTIIALIVLPKRLFEVKIGYVLKSIVDKYAFW